MSTVSPWRCGEWSCIQPEPGYQDTDCSRRLLSCVLIGHLRTVVPDARLTSKRRDGIGDEVVVMCAAAWSIGLLCRPGNPSSPRGGEGSLTHPGLVYSEASVTWLAYLYVKYGC